MEELTDKNRPQKLEEIFRNNMEEAEMAPSDNLWNRIEHDLDKQEKKYYQTKMVWFQRLAAACVLLLLFAGAYVFYDYQIKREPIIATAKPVDAPDGNKNKLTVTPPSNSVAAEEPETSSIVAKNEQPAKASEKVANKLKLARRKKSNDISDYPPKQNQIKEKQQDQRLPEPGTPYLAFDNIAASKELETVTIATSEENEVNTQSGSALPKNHENALLGEGENANVLPKAEVDVLPMLALTNLVNTTDSLKMDAPITIAIKPQPVIYAAAPSEPGKQKASRWSFSGKYAPHYFNQHISLSQQNTGPANPAFNNSLLASNASTASFDQALSEFDSNIQAGYSFNTEGTATYKLNQKWALESGLAYTQNIASTQSSYIFSNSQVSARYARESLVNNGFNDMHDNAGLVGVPATALIAALSGAANANASGIIKTQPFTTEYRYRLIGIPVKVNYQANRNKSFYYASVGFLTNLLVQAHILSDSPRVPDLKYAPNADSPFRNWQMAAVASVGKGFWLSKNFSFKAGLEASQYLNTLADNPLYLEGQHRKPYTFGVALSSTYTMHK